MRVGLTDSEMGCIPRLVNHYPSPSMGAISGFGCIHSYDLPVPRRNALSEPQVWPVSRSQMGKLRLWDYSSVHRFASAVVADAFVAGLRGES